MTTKLFQIDEIPVTKIWSENRARKDMGDLKELKESITKSGQLNPVLITTDYQLIAGERRVKAFAELGLDKIFVRIMPGLAPDDLMIIERMENVARKEFNWHEELELRYRLHIYWKEQAKNKNKSWGYRETAKKLECSLGGLSSDLTLAEALEYFPELKELKTKGKAREAYKKYGEQANAINSMNNLSDEQRDRMTNLMTGSKEYIENKSKKLKAKHDDIMPDISTITDGSQHEQPVENTVPSDDPDTSEVPEAIYAVKDLYEFIPDVPNNSVGLIELDPPYAIDFNINYGKTSNIKASEDDWTTEQLYTFYNKMLPILYKKLLDSSWMLCWTGKEHWLETNKLASEAGFKVQMPGIWAKPSGSTNTPKTNMVSNYEMFLLFRKGNATFNIDSMPSVITYDPPPASKRFHQWEKPLDMYKYFMLALSKPGSIFLSPFAGSGNSMIAAAVARMLPMGCDLRQKYAYSFYNKLNNYFIGE